MRHNLELRSSNHCYVKVIAPLLIILRASKQKTQKGNAILSRDNSLIRANRAKPMGDNGTLPRSHPMGPVGANRVTSGVRIEFALDSHYSKA